jgi:hypothetical protein
VFISQPDVQIRHRNKRKNMDRGLRNLSDICGIFATRVQIPSPHQTREQSVALTVFTETNPKNNATKETLKAIKNFLLIFFFIFLSFPLSLLLMILNLIFIN